MDKLSIKTKTQKLEQFASSSILLIVGIIVAVIGILAIFITVYFNVKIDFASELCNFKIDNFLLNILFTTLALIFMYLIYKILPKINKKILLVFVLLFSLILGLSWVTYIKYRPISDQSLVVYCGEKLDENDLPTILNPGEYLNRNPHQLGFCLYLMTVFRIFANHNVLPLQILNIVYSTLSALVLYLICKEIFKEEIVQKICLILIAFFSTYWAILGVHVYGNVPGLLFGLISLLFTVKFLDNNKWYNLIAIALSITIAYLLKNNYQIFLCAIIITLGLHFLKTYQKQAIAGMILIIIFMFSCKSLVYKHVEKGTGYSLSEGVPMIAYMYMGIAEPATLTPGWYTADVENIYNLSGYNREKSEEIAKDLLKNRLSYLATNPKYTLKYLSSKLQTTWLNPTFQVFWCSTPSTVLKLDAVYNGNVMSKPFINNLLCGNLQKVSERIMDVFQIIIFISAGISLILIHKKASLKELLLPLIFLGGFVFHIIWETKAVYAIQYFYIMLPFAAYGIYQLFKFIDKKISKTRD